MMRAARLSAAAVIAAGNVLAPIACFSERASGPAIDLEGCDVSLPAEAFGSSIVIIRDFAFEPAQVSVKPGSKVTWVNCDLPGSDSHTSTADAGAWDSPLLAPGSTFTRTFAGAGAFPYHCEPHPTMRGTITVD